MTRSEERVGAPPNRALSEAGQAGDLGPGVPAAVQLGEEATAGTPRSVSDGLRAARAGGEVLFIEGGQVGSE